MNSKDFGLTSTSNITGGAIEVRRHKLVFEKQMSFDLDEVELSF